MSLHYTKSTMIQDLTSITLSLNIELFTLSGKLSWRNTSSVLRSPCLLFSFCIHLIPFFLMVLLIMLSCFLFYFACFGNMLKSDCTIGDPLPLVLLPAPVWKFIYVYSLLVKSDFPSAWSPGFMGQASVAAHYWGIGNYALLEAIC